METYPRHDIAEKLVTGC